MEVYLPALDKTIQVRALKVKEINLLTDRSAMQSGTAVNALLKDTLIDEEMDPIDMLEGDRNAILIGVRRASYGDDYDIEVTCPSCRQRALYTVDLSKLEVKPGNRSFVEKWKEDRKALFPYKLADGRTIKWKFLDGHDFKKTIDMMKRKGDALVSESLMLKIKAIEGGEEGVPLKRQIEDLTARDLAEFNEFYDSCSPGHDSDIELVCQNGLCGTDFTVTLPIEPANFFKRSVRGKI